MQNITILPKFSTMYPVENSGKLLFYKAPKIPKVIKKLPSLLELKHTAASLRQFFNKQEEVMECTGSGEEIKQCALCQPIGLKPLKHFVP